MEDGQTGTEGLTIEEIAAQMLGMEQEDSDEEEYEDEEEDHQGHPAWRGILDLVPQENQAQVREQLASWDAGVNRRFQKIHDEYAPYKDLDDYDPAMLKTAADVYSALLENPQNTWETIGKVYGLSPTQAEDEDDEEDGFELPASVRSKLSKLDQHEQIIGRLSQEFQQLQAAEQEAQEDAELEQYLEDLAEEYGDFDEEYVVGLIAAGVDGEEAVGRYQNLINRASSPRRNTAPTVMSGSGGIPTSGSVNVSKLNKTDTQNLVAELLRLTASE